LTNRFSHSPKGLPSKKNADASFLKSLPFLNESNRHLIKKRCVPTVLVIELSSVSDSESDSRTCLFDALFPPLTKGGKMHKQANPLTLIVLAILFLLSFIKEAW